MTITDVRVRRFSKEGKMKAVVSITIDGEFVVHDIKVIEGEKGLFIAMPSRKTAEGEYRDIAHPINSETRQQMQDIILTEYEKAIDRVRESHSDDRRVDQNVFLMTNPSQTQTVIDLCDEPRD